MRKTSGNWGKIGREEKSGGKIREKMTKSGGKSGEFGRKGQNREVSRNSGESGNPVDVLILFFENEGEKLVKEKRKRMKTGKSE